MSDTDLLYFDTSALLPYYREEATSRRINDLLLSLEPPILISDLTRVEFFSAVGRWVRMDELTDPQASLLENTFMKDIRSGLLVNVPLGSNHYRQAEKWLSARKAPLRTLDGLHLACCLYQDAEMITCDTALHRAAEAFNIVSRLIEADTELS